MKRLQKMVVGLSIAACGGLSALPVMAQETRDDAPAARTAAVERTSPLDDKTRGSKVRVSQLMGMNIENSQGKSVGEIEDLVLDTKTGKVEYVAVTYGGFLGLGDKLFAVPMKAFQTKTDPDDRDDYVLVLDVTQQQLEGAQGFDQDHWPNFADPKFTDELHRRYRVDRDRDPTTSVPRGDRQDRTSDNREAGAIDLE
jgi:sporulation protein YlmC with PRC-barrel domain